MEKNHRDSAVTQNLRDANCSGAFIQQFLIIQAGDRATQLRLLKKRRADLLAVIHENERYLECLDYLVYQISREEREAE